MSTMVNLTARDQQIYNKILSTKSKVSDRRSTYRLERLLTFAEYAH
jgi:hypothetical protein